MQLQLNFDASQFTSAFAAVVNQVQNFFDSVFGNPAKVTIDLTNGGAGDGKTFATDDAGNELATGPAALVPQALVNEHAFGSNFLPQVNPFGNVDLTVAEAKALGLVPNTNTNIDGNITLFAPALSGGNDLFGTLAHEITEIMGRVDLPSPAGNPFPFDFFRFSAPGVHPSLTSTTPPQYFSLDGGATNLGNLNPSGQGDLADFAASEPPDAFGNNGPNTPVTPRDIAEMGALGWMPVSIPSGSAITATLAMTQAMASFSPVSSGLFTPTSLQAEAQQPPVAFAGTPLAGQSFAG